jgi:hypothetical protein
MAIKGKKKSQSRGAQARRRPASAPRPIVGAHTHQPWYKTATGRTAAIIVVVLIVSLGAGLLVNASSDEGLESRRAQLEAYTNQVRDLRSQVTEATTEMSQAPLSPRQEGFDEVAQNAQRWGRQLGQAVGVAASLENPAALAASAELLSQAVRTWATAAQTFEVAATIDGDEQPRLFVLAASQREQALEMWNSALETLETARADADMDPSGLQPPAQPSVAPPPGTSPPAGSEGNGGGGNNGGGNREGSEDDGEGN